MNQANYFDVLIVGAGLSGIGAAHYLQAECPNHTYVILEMREVMGGTWDLFRYPGIRSDSDAYTLGYDFRPWREDKAITEGDSILKYIKDTAKEEGIDQKIKYKQKVLNASWSSEKAQWTLDVEQLDSGEVVSYYCNFLHMCSGYYSYDEGYTPDFKGMEQFQGQIVHPQKWTDDIVYDNKKVVIIGSGATAVTLVPALAEAAASVTMLQRSPSYIVAVPAKDKVANVMRKVLPDGAAHHLIRWKNVLLALGFYKFAQRFPQKTRNLILNGTKKGLSDVIDVDKHFTPHYNPWDQRLCLAPDADFFHAIKQKKATIVTDHIDRFTEKGLLLKSGETLEADLIVTATGLQLKFLGGVEVIVDGKPVDLTKELVYRGAMVSNVPNLAVVMGNVNLSWTLRASLISQYVCRLLNHMRAIGAKQCTPRVQEEVDTKPLIEMNSGYFERAKHLMPRQGAKQPWALPQNYILDIFNIKRSSLKDKALEFK